MPSIQWKTLETLEHLEEAISRSQDVPVAIFKHSTRCSVSFMAKKTLELTWKFNSDEIEIYFLDLIRFRPISNEIAQRFKIHHESPQLIVLQDGKAVYNVSHNDISVDDLQTNLLS